MASLDELWADLLSGDPQQTQRAWSSLQAEERQAILQHLLRMRDETGWLPSQREAAAAAIAIINNGWQRPG